MKLIFQPGMDPGLAAIIQMGIEPALQAAGVSEVYGGFHRASGSFDAEVWFATDLGFLYGSAHAPPGRDADGIPATDTWKLELCPWADVINPEVSLETVWIDLRWHARIRLLIQLPRVDIVGGGDELASLVSAVMRAKAR